MCGAVSVLFGLDTALLLFPLWPGEIYFPGLSELKPSRTPPTFLTGIKHAKPYRLGRVFQPLAA